MYSVAVPHASVTFEIDRIYIIEDRDFGAGEIYLKITVNTDQPIVSSIYSGINDGDTLQLDWIVFSGTSVALTVLIDVWESDADYDELSNDFLGQASFSWDCQNAFAGWYDCIGPSGGNNQVQAQVYVVAEVDGGMTTDTGASIPASTVSSQIDQTFSGIDLLIALGGIIFTVLILASVSLLFFYSLRGFRRSQQQREHPPPSSREFIQYKPKKVTTLESISLSLSTQPFFCQLCGERHPAGSLCLQCDACARMICVDAYENMVAVGRSSCPMCGGKLHRV
jgi:hypothetical protein